MTPLAIVLSIVLCQAAPAADPAAQAKPEPWKYGPVVIVDTGLGKIRIGLRQDKAPISVKNFMGYVYGGHYDGTIFHRVIPKFMIQGGGLEPDMTEHPTMAPIRSEARNGLRNQRGSVAMARTSDPNSAKAQFFVNLKDNHNLDFGIGGAGYTVFGEVLEGMDVVDNIARVPTITKGYHENVPTVPVIIESIREVE